jgi:hypothetical protein
MVPLAIIDNYFVVVVMLCLGHAPSWRVSFPKKTGWQGRQFDYFFCLILIS